MTLKEYAYKVSKLAEKMPNAIVVYAKDEEGNGYDEVFYDPTVGTYNKADKEFYTDASLAEKSVKAVCIN